MRKLSKIVPTATLFAALILVWNATAQAQEPAPQGKSETPAAESGGIFGIHGTFAMKYRLRSGEGDVDQDLYEFLAADAGDADKDMLTAHVFLRASEDFDGNRESGLFYAFNEITNTYQSRVNERLYYAYADIHRLGPIESIRLGRQFQHETPTSLYFDGATAFTKEFKEFQNVRLGAYGGIPVHLYESPISGDSLVGAWLQGSLWKGAKARVDYTNVRDSQTTGTNTDDLLAVNFWQSFGTVMQLQYQHTLLDGHNRDLLARAGFWEPAWDLRVQASYYQLLATQRLETVDVDFFTSAAQQYFPYWQWRFLISKGFEGILNVDAGVDFRRLVDADKEGPFNHEFRRYFLTPSIKNCPVKYLDISVTWELWDTYHGINGDITTYGIDISYKPVEQMKLSAGSEYLLYKFDVLFNEEHESVRTFFMRARYAVDKDLRVDASFEFENSETGDFSTLKVGASQDF